MDTLIYAAIIIFAIVLLVVIILLKKIDARINDAALKVDFFDQKMDSENGKIIAMMNQQYTDVLTALKELKEKVNPELDMNDEDLYEQAKEVVLEHGICSASLLQRTLRVGYARAAQLLDILEDNGVVGPGDGARPREVFKQSLSDESDESS